MSKGNQATRDAESGGRRLTDLERTLAVSIESLSDPCAIAGLDDPVDDGAKTEADAIQPVLVAWSPEAAAAKPAVLRFAGLSKRRAETGIEGDAAAVDSEADAPLETAPGHFDAALRRRDFPILQEVVNGRALVWLDNAATTQKPERVIERIARFYRHENSNVHRGAHALASRANDAFDAARDKVRRFLRAKSPGEIVFTRGTTESINLVARGWGRAHVRDGDEIVVSGLEHHSNIVPWQMLAADVGARLRVIPLDANGDLRLDLLGHVLGRRTKLVAVTHVSNAIGSVTAIEEVVAAARRVGARVLVDGAQAVSHMAVDVNAIGCDFYAFSGHKVFGPTGIGVLYGRAEALDEIGPWQGGGSMIGDVTFEKTVYQPPPARFEAGTGNIAGAVGLGAATDYVTRAGMANIAAHEQTLLEHLEAGLDDVPRVRVIGRPRCRAGVVSFLVDGWRPDLVGAALDREGIAVRAGHHCALPALRSFGIEGTVRASLALYNTRADIDALVAAVRALPKRPG